MKSLLNKSRLAGLMLVVLFAFSAAYWMGCESPSGPASIQEQVFDETHPQLRAAIAVQDRYTDMMMSNSEVVGTGTSLTDDGRPAIVVFAKSENLKIDAGVKMEALAKGAKLEAMPATIESVPVVIEISGEVTALQGPIDPTDRFPRPVPIGVSTGHPAITAGTIGCRVTKNGQVYALSNNHVYADENQASIGDDVIQPGTYDGGSLPNDKIGDLSDFQTIVFSTSANNVIDAAIALSSTSLLSRSTPSNGYGTPRASTMSASVNLRVKKYGRTTGQTSARVYAINTTVNVGYSTGTARFINQVAIRGGGFSAGGDSGSLIVVNGGSNDRRPVALLFAGGGNFTFANPISNVLSRFGVTVDGN